MKIIYLKLFAILFSLSFASCTGLKTSRLERPSQKMTTVSALNNPYKGYKDSSNHQFRRSFLASDTLHKTLPTPVLCKTKTLNRQKFNIVTKFSKVKTIVTRALNKPIQVFEVKKNITSQSATKNNGKFAVLGLIFLIIGIVFFFLAADPAIGLVFIYSAWLFVVCGVLFIIFGLKR